MKKEDLTKVIIKSYLWRQTIVFLFTLALLFGAAESSAQNAKKITLKIENASYSQIFKAIEKQSKYLFFYNDEISNQNQKFNINEKNVSIEQLLEVVLKNSDLTYKMIEENIVISNKRKENNKRKGHRCER